MISPVDADSTEQQWGGEYDKIVYYIQFVEPYEESCSFPDHYGDGPSPNKAQLDVRFVDADIDAHLGSQSTLYQISKSHSSYEG